MEVGEQHLPAPYQLILRLDRFLYLDDHLRHGVYILDGRQYLRPGGDILLVAEAASLARMILNIHFMSMTCKFLYSDFHGSFSIKVIIYGPFEGILLRVFFCRKITNLAEMCKEKFSFFFADSSLPSYIFCNFVLSFYARSLNDVCINGINNFSD